MKLNAKFLSAAAVGIASFGHAAAAEGQGRVGRNNGNNKGEMTGAGDNGAAGTAAAAAASTKRFEPVDIDLPSSLRKDSISTKDGSKQSSADLDLDLDDHNVVLLKQKQNDAGATTVFDSAAFRLLALPETCPVTSPIRVSASSTYTTFIADNLINKSGLTLGASGLIDATHDDSDGNMWSSEAVSSDPTPTLDFELGRMAQISNAYIWQWGDDDTLGLSQRGINEFEIWYSTDGICYTLLKSTTLPLIRDVAQIVDMQGVTASHVRFEVKSNHGGSFTGLSEVAFGMCDPAQTSKGTKASKAKACKADSKAPKTSKKARLFF